MGVEEYIYDGSIQAGSGIRILSDIAIEKFPESLGTLGTVSSQQIHFQANTDQQTIRSHFEELHEYHWHGKACYHKCYCHRKRIIYLFIQILCLHHNQVS